MGSTYQKASVQAWANDTAYDILCHKRHKITNYPKNKNPKICTFVLYLKLGPIPVGIYLFKVNNGITRLTCEIGSTLTTKTPERRK